MYSSLIASAPRSMKPETKLATSSPVDRSSKNALDLIDPTNARLPCSEMVLPKPDSDPGFRKMLFMNPVFVS